MLQTSALPARLKVSLTSAPAAVHGGSMVLSSSVLNTVRQNENEQNVVVCCFLGI